MFLDERFHFQERFPEFIYQISGGFDAVVVAFVHEFDVSDSIHEFCVVVFHGLLNIQHEYFLFRLFFLLPKKNM